MYKKLPALLSIFLCLFAENGFSAANVSITETGLPQLQEGGVRLLSADYVFWAKDWAWASHETKFRINAPFNYSTSATNKKLGFKLVSNIQKSGEKQLVWKFDLEADSPKNDVIGGGISFKLAINEVSGKNLGVPVLLPNNEGWKWGDLDRKGVEIRFQPSMETVYFERNRKSEIRAYFYKGKIPKGKRSYTMTMTLVGDINILPTLGERFGTEDSQTWPKDPMPWQSFPVDLSFLNAGSKPAGKYGFVKAQDDELIFENGTQARFWGTNITAYTLFTTSKINITKQARRLSAMGFNLVRIHHHDSPWVDPNIFGARSVPDTQRLSKQSLDKLDWWIKSLKEEGIYVWLDLHVQRYLTVEDNIYAFDEIKKNRKRKGADLKGYNYVNLTIKNSMKRFNREYISHVNPYTNLAYKDEPAIMAMLLTNENDVTNHFGNRLLPNKNVPRHNKIYMHESRVFANQNKLSVDKTWRSWEHGPSKIFLNDLENRFNKEMIADLREIGVKIPIVTTNTWGDNPISSLPALTTGDIVDVHTYGSTLELEKDPFVTPNMTTWMAAGQVANMPMSITEWNVSPFPTPDRHVSSLLVASKARHQGWDAIMQYAYSQNSLDQVGKPSNWHAHNDPAMLATLPAAALLYRNGHVREADTTYYLSPGKKLFYENISPNTSVAIRTASEKGRLVIAMPETKELPWLIPSSPPTNAIIIEDYKRPLIKADASSVTSDTGELYRNWVEGYYTINTKNSQAVMGWVGNKSIKLDDTEFNLITRNATVAVQSLEDAPINQSKEILVTLSTNAMPYKDLQGQIKLPFLSEPMKGKLSVKAVKGLHLSYITGAGVKQDLPAKYNDGRYIIELNDLPLTHWLRLSKTQ